MDVHDVDEEEKITERAIASGESAQDFDTRLTPSQNERTTSYCQPAAIPGRDCPLGPAGRSRYPCARTLRLVYLTTRR